MTSALPPYVVLEKAVGQTPLQCAETWRAAAGVAASVPLAYAGRLDPMASGKLLVLIGDECKNQTNYHNLDKGYDFSVLLGIGSDTHDVLGRLTTSRPDTLLQTPSPLARVKPGQATLSGLFAGGAKLKTKLKQQLELIASDLVGDIELPYPHFSSKTVQGKPLHTWTLEGRLSEIDIPTKTSTIYNLHLTGVETGARLDLAPAARQKIDTIPPVTEVRKALGNDFRRADVRADWAEIASGNFGPSATPLPDTYHIAHFHCIASSGTYMRTLAHIIGGRLAPPAPSLAWSIHRTHMGTYDPTTQTWKNVY